MWRDGPMDGWMDGWGGLCQWVGEGGGEKRRGEGG